MVHYYSIWSVEPDEEGKSIQMVIFIKTQMFFSVRGVGASPLVYNFCGQNSAADLAVSHCSAVLNVVTLNIAMNIMFSYVYPGMLHVVYQI
jgi:hypothetical protein